MHMRGKDDLYAHIRCRTKRCCRCRVRFQLADYYEWRAQLLAEGTKLEVIAHFDNSTGNKFNPDATKDVRWAIRRGKQMMIGFYSTIAPLRRAATPQP